MFRDYTHLLNVEQTMRQVVDHNSAISRREARALQDYARFIKRFARQAGEQNASLIVQIFKYFDSQKFGVDRYQGALWQFKPGLYFFPLDDHGTSEYILHVKGKNLYLGIFLRDEQGHTTVQLADLPLETVSPFDTQRQSFWNTIAAQRQNPLQLALSE